MDKTITLVLLLKDWHPISTGVKDLNDTQFYLEDIFLLHKQ